LVIYLHEYYRIITSTLFHGSLMHIGMNMMSTLAISTMLEKKLGTLRHVISTLWAILLTGVIYLVVAYVGYVLFNDVKLMYQHSIGFSGIIFHMSILECNLSPSQSRSIFGVFSVPSWLYPWALLIVLQMVVPGLSFLGHLAGILTGTLQFYGILDCILVGEAYLHEMESWSALQWLVNRPNFAAATPSGSSQSHQEPSALIRSLWKGVSMVFKFIRDVLETLKVCIFGRGRNVNSNIQLDIGTHGGWGGGNTLGAGADDTRAIDDDDEWGGLPPMPAQESRLV
jgi:hypothetical protein